MDFESLKNTILWGALSNFGKMIFQPNGIFYWAGRAKKEADVIGTIGSIVGIEDELVNNANNNKVTYYIPAIRDYIDKDPANIVPYAPISGLPTLREHWKNWIVEKGKQAKNLPSGSIDVSGKLSLPAVTPGITNGIFLTTRLFLDPKESIISPNKRWGNYDSIITRQCGVNIDSFEVFTEEMKFNLSSMEDKIRDHINSQGRAVMILNFPNNPTGYVPKKDEAANIVKKLETIANDLRKPISVISDDAYEGYVYNNTGITASLFYELVNKNEYIIPVKLDGASKEMLMYGGRIGFVTLGLNEKWFKSSEKEKVLEEFENKIQGIIRSTVSNSNRIIQSILIQMFESGIEKIIESRKKIIEIVGERYKILNDELAKLSAENTAISVDPNSGGFFLLINLDPKVEATDFNEHLLKNYKTGLIPIVKPKDGINALRVAYSSIPKEQLPILVDNIKKSLSDLNLG
ncbi:MAG: aminotransferase class I/II-fold pyridoxal phosphate-dependent enzyme [Candidatus Lokiarchaeota archaeon]|nr:aminotransferase class I/II-fold pyridoxal phosphate-dependent enzyme [Candidatus Lokiarchaeota archaeon]